MDAKADREPGWSLTGVAALLLCLVGGAAQADEPWSFVQITCAPELSYVSVQRFTVMNPPSPGRYLSGHVASPAAVRAIQVKYGMFDSESLKAHPFVCTIPPVPPIQGYDNARPGFAVRVEGRYEKPPDSVSDYAQMLDEVDISLNGRPLGRMGLNPAGIEIGPDTVSVAPNGVGLTVIVCEISDQQPRAGNKHVTCASTDVPPAGAPGGRR